jgi:ceramide glucosyltransferase
MIQVILPFIIILPPLIYLLLTLWCGASFFRRNRVMGVCIHRPEVDELTVRCSPCTYRGYAPPVTILKPVKGVDRDSFENFASYCSQDYPRFQIIFAADSPDDPVIPVIERLRVEFPATDMELVVDGTLHGPNYKVGNLINAYPLAKHDIIIVCDSDIRVPKEYLRDVCARFEDPGVGLITSLYRSSTVDGAASALEALGFTCEMVPNVLVALKLEGLSFALGASMAVRRDLLEQIGGFAALVDFLADDYQLGNMVRRAGYRVELSGCFVESIMHRETLPSVLFRQLRWGRTMRVSRPGGYFASGLTRPFTAAALALLLTGCSSAGITSVLILYTVSMSTSLVYSRRFLKDHLLPRRLWLIPVRDAVSSVIWGLAFLGNRVTWRGHRFRLLPGGRIEEVTKGR